MSLGSLARIRTSPLPFHRLLYILINTRQQPWALAISMFGVFGIFFMELIAFRVGTQRLKALGMDHDPHGHGVAGGSHAAHGPEHYTGTGTQSAQPSEDLESASGGSHSSTTEKDLEKQAAPSPHDDHHHHHHSSSNVLDDPIPQIIGVAILEFGVLLHSLLIGLTLAVDPAFKILFVVIVFHRKSLIPHPSISSPSPY
jgi:zinc transporter 1/2/3